MHRQTQLLLTTGTVQNRTCSHDCRWWREGSARRLRHGAAILSVVAVAACAQEPASNDDGTLLDPADRATGKADTTVGPIDEMVCNAAEPFVRRGDFVEVDVEAFDKDGHRSRNYQLTVSPGTARVVQRNKVVFEADGDYRISCLSLDSELEGETVVVVGNEHPALSVSVTPLSPGSTTVITGQARSADGSDVKVAIDGVDVPVDTNGHFSHQVSAAPGPNRFEVVATDGRDRSTERRAWTIAGQFGDLDELDNDAIAVGISPAAYGQLGDVVAVSTHTLLTDPDFQNELFEELDGSRLGLKWRVQPQLLTLPEPNVTLSPTSSGIRFQATLHDVVLYGWAKTKFLLGGWKHRDFSATSARVVVSGELSVRGPHAIAMHNVAVELADIELEVSDLPEVVEDVITWFFEDDITTSIRDAIDESSNTALSGVADGFAHTSNLSLPHPFLGELTFDRVVDRLEANNDGLVVGLAATVDGETDPLRRHATGPWKAPYEATRVGSGGMYQALVSVDAINRLLFATWQTGGMDLAYAAPASALSRAPEHFPQLHTLDIFADPKMPPVIVATEHPDEFLLHISDLRVDAILDHQLGVWNMGLAVGAVVRVRISAEGKSLSASATVEQLDMDVLVAPGDFEPEPVREFLEDVMRNELLPRYGEVVGSFPVPEADLSDTGVPGLTSLTVSDLAIGAPGRGHGIALSGGLVFR